MDRVEQAAMTYLARTARTAHPGGFFDKAQRWMPSDIERQPCCATIRNPSRNHPFSLMTHCRSVQHVANFMGVDPVELRRIARQQRFSNRIVDKLLAI